jgi:dUTP pyrophosphatase
MKLKVIKRSKYNLHEYPIKASARIDLQANPNKKIMLKPMQRVIVPTGSFLENYAGNEALAEPRSGLSIKKNISELNSAWTIDAVNRGEVSSILLNLSDKSFIIDDGERIGQMVIWKQGKAEWDQAGILLESERVGGGFEQTGKR